MKDEMNDNPVIGKSFDFHGESSTFIHIFPTGKRIRIKLAVQLAAGKF